MHGRKQRAEHTERLRGAGGARLRGFLVPCRGGDATPCDAGHVAVACRPKPCDAPLAVCGKLPTRLLAPRCTGATGLGTAAARADAGAGCSEARPRRRRPLPCTGDDARLAALCGAPRGRASGESTENRSTAFPARMRSAWYASPPPPRPGVRCSGTAAPTPRAACVHVRSATASRDAAVLLSLIHI